MVMTQRSPDKDKFRAVTVKEAKEKGWCDEGYCESHLFCELADECVMMAPVDKEEEKLEEE
jgi:hypothetical protein